MLKNELKSINDTNIVNNSVSKLDINELSLKNKSILLKINDIKKILLIINLNFKNKIKEFNLLKSDINKLEQNIEILLKDIRNKNDNIFIERWDILLSRLTIFEELGNGILLNEKLSNSEFCSIYKEILSFRDFYYQLLNKYNLKEIIWNINLEIEKIAFLSWNTDNTYKNIYDLINSKIINITILSVEISFIKINLNDKLKSGNNNIDIKISIGGITETLKLNIKDVILNENDSFDFIKAIFKNIINWKLDTSNTYNDILKLIEIEIKKNDNIKNNFTLELINKNAKSILEVGNNKRIFIKIIFPNNTYNFDIIIATILNKINEFNFNKIDKIITNKTTDNTYNDILNEIQLRIRTLSNELKIKLLNIDLNDKLSKGNKIIGIIVIYNEEKTNLNFIIKDVKVSISDLKKLIEKFLNQKFIFNNLNENFTFSDLNQKLIQKLIQNFGIDNNRIKIKNYYLDNKIVINNKGEISKRIEISVDNDTTNYEVNFIIKLSDQELVKRLKIFLRQLFDFNLNKDNKIKEFILKLKDNLKENFGQNIINRVIITNPKENFVLDENIKFLSLHTFNIKVDNNISFEMQLKIKLLLTNEQVKNILLHFLDNIFDFNLNENSTISDLISKIKNQLAFEFNEEILEQIKFNNKNELIKLEQKSKVIVEHSLIIQINDKIEIEKIVKLKLKFSKDKLKRELHSILDTRFKFELDEKITLDLLLNKFQISLENKLNLINSNRIIIKPIGQLLKFNNKGENEINLNFFIDNSFVFNKFLKFTIVFSFKELQNRFIESVGSKFIKIIHSVKPFEEMLKKLRLGLNDEFGFETANRIKTVINNSRDLDIIIDSKFSLSIILRT